MPEPRTPVMIVVEASWEDPGGALQTASARMEDKSSNGACIRLKRPIDVGTRLRIQWRFEQFSGVVKYCRTEGRDFIVGLQKDSGQGAIVKSSPRTEVPVPAPQISVRTEAPVLLPPQAASLAQTSPGKPQEISITMPPTQIELIVRVAGPPAMPMRAVRYEREMRRRRHSSRIHAGPPVRRTGTAETKTTETTKSVTPKAKEGSPERKPMKRKWLDLAPWNNKQESPDEVKGEASGEASSEAGVEAIAEPRENPRIEKEKVMSNTATQSPEKSAGHSSREVPAFQVELLPTEEIFRAAGITMPRRGYSVAKVIEMINSEHIRSLSKEMKRAAVLMALDAAGISVEQIQRDAKARQDALDSYENTQKKQAETEWARKADEIAQIQSELESIKAHYSARISRCTEALSRDKSRFSAWVATKDQETRNMAEAVELCGKPAGGSSSSSMASAATAGAGGGGLDTGKPA